MEQLLEASRRLNAANWDLLTAWWNASLLFWSSPASRAIQKVEVRDNAHVDGCHVITARFGTR